MMMLLALLLSAGADEAAAGAALDAFKAAAKSKDPALRAAAVAELAKTDHPKVAAKLAAVLMGDLPEARIAAAKGLAFQVEDPKKSAALAVQGAAANAKDPVVLAAVVATLGKLGEEVGAPELNKHYQAENLDLAKAAIEAAGELKSAATLDALIRALKDADEMLKPRDPNQPGGRDFLSRLERIGANPRESRERARELQPLLKKTLAGITGVQCQDGKDFEDWWKENRAKFKPQK
jgi:HEAT repeat protein